ncbi:hypothetical protein LCGC14_2255700 [marine sediment metagenome]|uniref:Uncharacterized protein n=1 Tax=marine sediment metagenome TaxID=412755 RepID=A0A0F9D1L7_9ZZZZ
MANATYTGETSPTGLGPATQWYQPSTGQWRIYNAGTSQWVLIQDGFESLKVGGVALVTGGLTGEFEGTFKKIKIENGIITEIEVEE